MLERKEFNVLDCLACTSEYLSQRKIAKQTKMSVASVNKILTTFENAGFTKDGKITLSGLKQLEPYRVKRAVIMAAGFGSRLIPITLNTPNRLSG